MAKSKKTNIRYKYSPLSMAIISAFFISNASAEKANAATENMEFDASFLNVDNANKLDLSRFAYGSSGTPGIYKTAIYINDRLVSNKDIEFRARDNKSVYPCLSLEVIKNIPFNYDKLPADFLPVSGESACFDLQKKLPDAKVNYDSNEQRLDITIPQIYMQNTARGTVSPELWDSGIPAMMLGYNVNGYTSEANGRTFNSLYAGLNAGLNIGAWYLRHNGAYTKAGSDPADYTSINTYLQRDIPAMKSRALVGQSNTNGELFDTVPFTGVQLATDERMLPESLRGYAPEIRGIARTNARVTVRQGDQILYETSVPPGAFLINDLYPTGYGGDLVVTVREADGSEQYFRVPYASVAQLLRPGSSRYALTAGKLRSNTLRDEPMLYQATWQHGITNNLTGYAGMQFSPNYYALQIGTAVGLPIGAVSFDVTHARTRLEAGRNAAYSSKSERSSRGQSYQISYSKLIRETNSNISLAAYRFSTDGYMDFLTAMQTRDAVKSGLPASSVWRAKNRMTLTFGQGLPENWGQLYLSGSLQNYWNKEGTDKQYQFGYNNQYGRLSWGLSVARTFSSQGRQQTNYLLSFSLPLGRPDSSSAPQLRTDLTHDTSGRTGEQLSLSGSAGEENQYTYGVTAMHLNQGIGTTGSLNGSYRSGMTMLNASLSTGKDYHSVAGGMSGTVVAHSGGITFTPYTSDTFALVEAKGAEGAKVSTYPGIRIDSRGYAVVPYLNPYQMNDVSIDPKGISTQTELTNSSQKTAPYLGAVVKMKYETRQGTAVLINTTWQGEPVPFGAEVLDSQGSRVGSAGQGGQIYARVGKDKDRLLVKWGEDRNSQCHVGYQLMPVQKDRPVAHIQQYNSICQ